jgi:hypothetical protein
MTVFLCLHAPKNEEELEAIRLEISDEIKGMTPEEEVAYLRAQTALLHEQYHYRVVNHIEKGEEVSA